MKHRKNNILKCIAKADMDRPAEFKSSSKHHIVNVRGMTLAKPMDVSTAQTPDSDRRD